MMYSSLESAFIKKILKKEKQDSDTVEIFVYGLRSIMFTSLNILSTFAIGMWFKDMTLSILFLTSYIPLRTYCGGYHANSYKLCYIFSIVLVVCMNLFVKMNITSVKSFILFLATLSVFIIFLKSPIQSINKPLSQREISIYSKYAKRIVVIEYIVLLILLHLNFTKESACITFSLTVICVMMEMGYIKWNKNYKMNLSHVEEA